MSPRVSRGLVSAPAPAAGGGPSVVPTVPVTGTLVSAGRREDVVVERVVAGGLFLRTAAGTPRLLGPVACLEVARGTTRPWSTVGRVADVTGGALFLAIASGPPRPSGRPIPDLVLTTAHPFVLGEQADVTVHAAGPDRIEASAAFPVLPGLVLPLHSGSVAAEATVEWTRPMGDRVRFGCRLSSGHALRPVLADALFRAGVTPVDLVADGFERPAVRHLLEGRVVEDVLAYEEVLDLRARTLRGTGRRVLDPAPESHAVAGECDAPSKVLAWWHGPRLVASLALELPDDEADVVVVRRLCIDPAYRHSDCVRRLFEEVHAVLVTSGRRTIAIEAPPWLRGAYAFLGFAPTGRVRTAPEDDAIQLVEMRTTQHRWGTYGLHTDPVRWNLFLRDVTDALRERGLVATPAVGRAVLALYRGFRPLADRIERRLASGWRRA